MHRTCAVLVAALAALLLTSPAAVDAQTLNRVKERGRLVCGVNNALPGFGFLDSDGACAVRPGTPACPQRAGRAAAC